MKRGESTEYPTGDLGSTSSVGAEVEGPSSRDGGSSLSARRVASGHGPVPPHARRASAGGSEKGRRQGWARVAEVGPEGAGSGTVRPRRLPFSRGPSPSLPSVPLTRASAAR